MNRRHCLLSIIFTVLFVPIAFCTTTNAQKNVSLEFSAGHCDSQKTNPWNKSTLDVRNNKWLDNNTLKINAFVSLNCASKIAKGDYEIANDTIILRYTWSNPTRNGEEMLAKCMCAQELIYIFKNIKKKDYRFRLESKKDMSYSLKMRGK